MSQSYNKTQLAKYLGVSRSNLYEFLLEEEARIVQFLTREIAGQNIRIIDGKEKQFKAFFREWKQKKAKNYGKHWSEKRANLKD